jgi:hypothetical protein
VSSSDSVRFRQHGAIAIAALIVFISAIPLASARWYLAPLLLVPLIFAAWAWRSGTDADAAGLRVRALLGQRRIPWSQVAQLSADGRGRAVAVLSDGRMVRLTAVPVGELARLAGASGQRVGRGDAT